METLQDIEKLAYKFNEQLGTTFKVYLDETNRDGIEIENYFICQSPHVEKTILGKQTYDGFAIFHANPEEDVFIMTKRSAHWAVHYVFLELMKQDVIERIQRASDCINNC